MRFSLRTLLLFVTLIAIGMGIWSGYRRAGMCEVQWLKIDSAASDRWFPPPQIDEGNDPVVFVYHTRYRNAMELIAEAQSTSKSEFHSMPLSVGNSMITSSDVKKAEDALATLRSLDKRVPGQFVVRGVIVDRNEKRVSLANVKLRGPTAPFEPMLTWEDGQFTLPLYGRNAVVPGNGYYLHISVKEPAGKKRLEWDTPEFSLSAEQPELEVIVTVPWAAPKED